MASDYVEKYLRSAGVRAPYERTEAQIEEQNKSNPLSGYGFMSAEQKRRRAMEMSMIEKQQQQERDALQQQLIARMSSQEKIGHYAGAGLMGLMQHLKKKGASPEIPEAPPANDPELDRYNQLAQEVGPETALQILGQETGNASMLQQAEQQRMEKQKKEMELSKMGLDMQNTKSQISEREGKPNNVIMTQRTGPDGRPMQVSMEVIGKDPSSGKNIYRELGEAVKGSLTVDDPAKFGTSKAGINERTRGMENALTSTANTLDAYDKLETLVKSTPAGGWSGALVSKADDIISGVKNLGTIIADTEGREVKASMDLADYDFSKMEKFAGGAAKIRSLVLEVAYARAAATGDSSRSLSDRDVQNQIDIVGGSIANPKIFLELVQQSREMMVGKLENMGKYTKIDGEPIGKAYQSDIDGLKSRVGVTSKGGTRVMYRGNKKYNIPEDEVEAFKAAGGKETP
jgi:hypothetical protein